MVTYMKKTIKYIALTVLLILYFVFEPVKRSLDFELNLMGINYIFGKSLYDEVMVDNKYVEVIDYYIENDYLYIFPINGEIKLPFNVSVNKIDGNCIEVVDNDTRYYLYNIDKRNKNLYQYVYANDVIGYTNDYFIIQSDNIEYIVSKLIINYESV